MSESLLLFDAGNTRLKWAVKRGGVLHEHGAHTYSEGPLRDALSKQIGAPPAQALLASVASGNVDQDVLDWLTQQECSPEVVRVRPLEHLSLAYNDYEKLGVDRWLAMLGAQVLYPGPVCVADCGTALTVDAVTGDGQHLGGVIVPGFELMQRALLNETARIGAADVPFPDTLFGDSTGAAVNAGVTYCLASVLDRFVCETRQRVDDEPAVLVTGGGRDRLLRYAVSDVIEAPDLVLLGLATLSEAGA
ncbi:MAG: type III pantothenate kinase [Gammaproteobacteria bacterium]